MDLSKPDPSMRSSVQTAYERLRRHRRKASLQGGAAPDTPEHAEGTGQSIFLCVNWQFLYLTIRNSETVHRS